MYIVVKRALIATLAVHVILLRVWNNFSEMAPTRLAAKPIGGNENLNGILTHGITTRSKQLASLKTHKDNLKVPSKRKADSPLKDAMAKRAAFGDITNAINKSTALHDKDKVTVAKKVTVESKMLQTVKVNLLFLYKLYILVGNLPLFYFS